MTANAGMRSARNGAACSYKKPYVRPWNPSVRSTANTRPNAYAARTADQGGHTATAASVTAISPGNNRRSSVPNRSADHPYSLLEAGAAREMRPLALKAIFSPPALSPTPVKMPREQGKPPRPAAVAAGHNDRPGPAGTQK